MAEPVGRGLRPARRSGLTSPDPVTHPHGRNGHPRPRPRHRTCGQAAEPVSGSTSTPENNPAQTKTRNHRPRIHSVDRGLAPELAAQLADAVFEKYQTWLADPLLGESAAVYAFKQHVSHWSNQFAPELRDVARTIGNRINIQSREFKISQRSLMRHHERDQGYPVSKTTLIGKEQVWERAGGLKIIRNDQFSPDGNGGAERSEQPRPKPDPSRLGRDGRRVGRRGGKRMDNYDSSTYRVDFSVAVRARKVYNADTGRWRKEYHAEPWDFTQLGPEAKPFESRQVTESDANSDHQLTVSSPSADTYCSPSVPPKVPHSSSVPAQPGETLSRDEFRGEMRTDSRERLQNTYIIRTWTKSGKKAYANIGHANRLASKGAFSDQTVSISPAEAVTMWRTWPADHPQRKEAHLAYLLAGPDERAALVPVDDSVTNAGKDFLDEVMARLSQGDWTAYANQCPDLATARCWVLNKGTVAEAAEYVTNYAKRERQHQGLLDRQSRENRERAEQMARLDRLRREYTSQCHGGDEAAADRAMREMELVVGDTPGRVKYLEEALENHKRRQEMTPERVAEDKEMADFYAWMNGTQEEARQPGRQPSRLDLEREKNRREQAAYYRANGWA